MSNLQSVKVLSIDPGYGDCKIAYRSAQNAKIEVFKHVNIVAKLGNTNKNFGSSVDSSNVVELNGEQYLLGISASQTMSSQVINVDGYEAMRSITPLILKKYMDMYGKLERIIVTLSLAYIDRARDYKNFLVDTLSIDPEVLRLVPQGIGCKLALDNLGFNIEDSSFKKNIPNYLGIDIGFNTIDVIKVIDNSLIPQNIQGYPNIGIVKIVEKVKTDLMEMGCDGNISLSKMKVFLTQGFAEIRGKIYDLSEKIAIRTEEYIQELHKFLEKNYSEDLNSIECVVLFGGGANIVKNHKKTWDSFYEPDFIKIPSVSPEFYNALGGLFFKG